MQTLLDKIAWAVATDPVAWRRQQFGSKHLRHAAALQHAVDQTGYSQRKSPAGAAPQATAGMRCSLAVNPMRVEAQVQGAALAGLSMCLPGATITLKDSVVQQSHVGDFQLPRITAVLAISVHIVPSAEAPTGRGEPGLPPLAPALANAITKLTGKRLRELPFRLA